MRALLEGVRSIAVVGMSGDPAKAARRVPAFLMARGYEVTPVNPNREEILGRRSWPDLASLPEAPDLVEVFRPSAAASGVVEDALRLHAYRGGLRAIWLQEGVTTPGGAAACAAAGVEYYEDLCLYKEYVRLWPDWRDGGAPP